MVVTGKAASTSVAMVPVPADTSYEQVTAVRSSDVTTPVILTSTSPDEWTRDTDGDGYTDVEEELHRMASGLECAL